MRGVAALVVAFAHSLAMLRIDNLPAFWNVSFEALPGWQSLVAKLLGVPLNAGNAVILFFVMSGYVLCRSLAKEPMTPSRIFGFYYRRIWRIYPAFFVSVLVFFAIRRLVVVDVGNTYYSAWVQGLFAVRPAGQDLLRNLSFYDNSVSAVTWTMNVEMLGSFAMPPLVYLALRFGKVGCVILLAGLTMLSWRFSEVMILRYLICFGVGSVVAVASPMSALVTPRLLGLGGLFFLCLANPAWVKVPILQDLLANCGAVLLLLMVTLPVKDSGSFLDHPSCRFLGRVSYSFYLFHIVVLYALFLPAAGWLAGRVDAQWSLAINLAIFVFSAPLAMAVSAVTYRFIELPTMQFAKGRKAA